jgi:SAM-dependent methyltransferase
MSERNERSDTARAYFEAVAGRYEREYALPASESRARLAVITGELAQTPGARVLDLGVGTGRELSALLDAGHQPTGLDISPAMLARCAARARPVPLVEADLYAPLPFPGQSFDAVLALHGTLAHPPGGLALGKLAREIDRVLRPGGVVVIEVPTTRWLAAMSDRPTASFVPHDGARGRHVDPVTGAAIEVELLTSDQWRALFPPPFVTRIDDLGGGEIRLVARR